MHVVVIVDHAFISGGLAGVALSSALGLKARGHDVTVFAAVGPVDPRLETAGIDVVLLGQDDILTARSQTRFLAQVMWNATALKALDALLSRLDPARTLVHVHGWAKALSPSIGRALVRRPRLPVVYTMHDFFLVCPNGGFYDYRAQAICTRRPMSAACITTNCDLRSYPRKALRLARHLALDTVSGLPAACRHVITISDLQVEASARYFRAGTVLHRVDNPIEVPDLGPKLPGPPGDFLFVGRLSAEKGPAIFAEAARKAGIRPIFVGDGPAAAALREAYPEAILHGWKRPDEVRALMRGARALVFPSVWYEGQPLTVLEALAVGTPVIVSDACAGRESVRDGETGLWFRSADTDDLARALRQLSDDATASRMAAAAHARYWADPPTLDRHLDRLEEIYELARRDVRDAEPNQRLVRPREARVAS